MSLIEINNLTKEYQTGSASGGELVTAVDNVSLKIDQGEFITLTGQSGSGKSTLLSIIGGLNKPTNGNIIVDEIDVYKLSPDALADFRREYVGFVFQSFQLIPYLTVIENIIMPLAVNNHSRQEQSELAYSILKKIHLENKANRLINNLSGGEQQRVAIARSLVNDPLIILADEPTGNLDSKTSLDIMNHFYDLNNEGKTIIIVTHNPELVNQCGLTGEYLVRNVQMEDGKLSLEPAGKKTEEVSV